MLPSTAVRSTTTRVISGSSCLSSAAATAFLSTATATPLRSLPLVIRQRRHSSSKHSSTPKHTAAPPASAPKQSNGGASGSGKKKSAKSKASKDGAEGKQVSQQQDSSVQPPSVPSTAHIDPKVVYLASLFAQHRPLGLNQPVPPQDNQKNLRRHFRTTQLQEQTARCHLHARLGREAARGRREQRPPKPRRQYANTAAGDQHRGPGQDVPTLQRSARAGAHGRSVRGKARQHAGSIFWNGGAADARGCGCGDNREAGEQRQLDTSAVPRADESEAGDVVGQVHQAASGAVEFDQREEAAPGEDEEAQVQEADAQDTELEEALGSPVRLAERQA